MRGKAGKCSVTEPKRLSRSQWSEWSAGSNATQGFARTRTENDGLGVARERPLRALVRDFSVVMGVTAQLA